MIRSFRHKGLAKLWNEGDKPIRFALAVNGPWRITFEWEDGDALRVDLEQYH